MPVSKSTATLEDQQARARLAAQQTAARASSPAASEYAAGAVGGFNRGLTNLAGTPVDLMAMGLNLIPGIDIEEPFGGSESIRRGMDVMGGNFFPEPPDTTAGRFIARVGEEIGASALPAAGILKAASGVPKLATMGAGMGERLGQAFLDPIRRSPGIAIAGETAAATGAGAGAGAAEVGFPDNPTAEMFGQIFGGLSPAVLALLPTAVATRVVFAIVKKFSPEAAAQQGREAVQGMLADELTMEAERRLREAAELRGAMEGFDPSLAEATGSPALIATQRQLESNASGANLERVASRRAGSEAAVERYAAQQAPDGSEGPDFVVDTANGQINDLRARADVEEASIGGQRRTLAEGLPVADKPSIGENIRGKVLAARDAARTRMNNLAEELGINTEDVSAPFATWKKRLLGELTPESAYGDTAGLNAVKKALSRKRPKTKRPVLVDEQGNPLAPAETTTFQDVKAIRERLGDAILDEIGSAKPSRKKVRALVIAKRRLDEFIGELADGDVSGRYKQFRTAYFDEYIKPFEEGAVYKIRQRDGRGFYKTTDEKVADAFWQPGNISAARQYKALLGADPEANAALEAVALDSLRNATVRDGVMRPALFESWVRKHASLLDEFPAIRKSVSGIEQADRALVTRQGEVNARRQSIEDQLLTRELNAYSKATKTGEQVIDSAIRDPRKMRQLVNALKLKASPPEALASLRRHVWDLALEGGADDLLGFMAGNAESLAALFGKGHLKALTRVAVARSMHERVPAPRGAGFRPVPLAEVESAIGQGIPQIGSRIFAFKSGRMQKGYLVLDTLMRGLRGRAQATAEDLFRVALYDPEVARAMANAVNTGVMSNKTATQLQARYFALAPTLVEDE